MELDAAAHVRIERLPVWQPGQGIETSFAACLIELATKALELLGEDGELPLLPFAGEMSFVDSAPPSATVRAVEAGRALVITKAALTAKLKSDVAFASRFYHALAVFLADRLRGTVRRFGYGDTKSLSGDQVMADELDIEVLDTLALAGDRFSRMLKLLGAGPGR